MGICLILHQNFPGQFKFLSKELVNRGWQVRAFRGSRQPEAIVIEDGVVVSTYKPVRGSAPQIHPWVIDFEAKVIRADSVYRKLKALHDEGFSPDFVLAHPGWGESMFVKDVWPNTKLLVYCEFYYLAKGGDVGFDPEFIDPSLDNSPRLRIKNLVNHITFEDADAAIAPTHWQAASFPEPFRKKITVVHDGIDTQKVCPKDDAWLEIAPQGGKGPAVRLTKASSVITFVNRNLEPLRGYHSFMRSLPVILASNKKARVLIIGGDDVSYGAPPKHGKSWKQTFIDEVRGGISDEDWQRVHFLGNVKYEQFLTILSVSSVHVYLTYPFVLSWSLLEAMSAACCIVGSDTAPVREVLVDRETGRLVDFFDRKALAETILELLELPQERHRLGVAARAYAVENYDLRSKCLPAQIQWIERALNL